jgi:hypothetical protein
MTLFLLLAIMATSSSTLIDIWFFPRTGQPINAAGDAIGIGPGSFFFGFWRQIDFVRQSNAEGFLRLGGSEENFISHDCLPDSIMRMRTISTESNSTGGVAPRVETRISVSIGDNISAIDSVSFVDSERFLLTMPYMWIENSGLSPYLELLGHHRPSLPDCANNIHRLPIITLTFSDGGLRLLPEDYTRPIDQDGRCELLIHTIPVDESDQTVRFNPLMIPGVNARSTDNQIILCDSAVDI